jgi:hypothetical protein
MNFQFTGDRLGLGLYTQYILLTTQLFRDVSAWYHIVVALDTTNATADNRCRMYINGVEVTVFTTRNNPTLNADYGINQATQHDIGRSEYNNSTCLGGYMTEVNFIDGQALTPSSFGMTNPQTGQWIPLKYSGTYGTNGFYLNFKDATSTTTLGYDYSGNANNWTTNNFSVTAGAGNDSLTDVPTPWFAYNTTGDVGGVIRGNYCTWNPTDVSASATYTNGNLDTSSSSGVSAKGTIGVSSGKWYWEVLCVSGDFNAVGARIGLDSTTTPATNAAGNRVGSTTTSYSYNSWSGSKQNSTGGAYGATYTTNDIIGVAIDLDNGKIWWSKNGTFQASGDPVAGTNAAFTNLSGSYTPAIGTDTGGSIGLTVNFGQRPFAYTPPTGFRSLCTTNLPATAIGFGLTNQGDDYFNAKTYAGSASIQSITGIGFQPDLVWIKNRTAAESNQLVDAVRGATKALMSNETSDETTWTNGLTSFDSDGFTLGVNNRYNDTGYNYVAWNWKAAGSTVSNTAGSITSTVSANTTAGFSIATYTGTGSNATVGHGLGVAPRLVIVKHRSTASGGPYNWRVYHASLGNTGGVFLNTTAAFASNSGFWNDTTPTSTVFTIGTDPGVNASTTTYVAYCFAAVPGYSAFGTYTGNASTDGPFIYTGFRPRFIFGKDSGGTNNWWIFDSARDTYNVAGKILRPNLSDAELDSPPRVDLLSNGFKIRSVNLPNDATTYIYAAFAESPFQFANAR